MSNNIVFARMPEEDVELIRRMVKARGEDLSAFVRRSVYKELAEPIFLPEEQKSLRIPGQGEKGDMMI